MVCWIINRIFDANISDIFSGYRAFSRECALTIPITSRGFDVETVRWVVKRVAQNEYKRAQAVPGLKVTSKAFGAGRKMPVAQHYSE